MSTSKPTTTAARFLLSLVLPVSSLALAGCLAEADAGLDTDVGEQAGISPNGISPNGISPNGISPNGAFLSGLAIQGVAADGAAITAAAAGGPPLVGGALVASRWTALLSDGAKVELRIDTAAQGSGANADVWSYGMAYQTDGGWQPLCGLDKDGRPIQVDSVQGSWNLLQGVPGGGAYTPGGPGGALFSIACRGSAIAKCVELGYKPWKGYGDQLAACVRALRADYCGNGTSYTVNGTLVNLYDSAAVQADATAWVPEAEWTPAGARCISRKDATRFYQVAFTVPSCYPTALAELPECGARFSAGTSLITELAPR